MKPIEFYIDNIKNIDSYVSEYPSGYIPIITEIYNKYIKDNSEHKNIKCDDYLNVNCENCISCWGCKNSVNCIKCRKCDDCIDCKMCWDSIKCVECINIDSCSKCIKCIDCDLCDKCVNEIGKHNPHLN